MYNIVESINLKGSNQTQTGLFSSLGPVYPRILPGHIYRVALDGLKQEGGLVRGVACAEEERWDGNQ